MTAIRGAFRRLTSKHGAVFPAVLGTLFATGLMLTLAAASGAPLGIKGAASSNPSSGDPASLVTGPPIPLTIPGPQRGDTSGYSVACLWPTVVVGMPYTSVGGHIFAGQVLVENMITGVATTLNDPLPTDYGLFGNSVALSSTTLVVGAPDGGVVNESHVFVYNAATLQLEATLADPEEPLGGYFGLSVATSGNTVVVGAPDDNVTGLKAAGHVFVYSSPTWAPSVLASPDPSFFGVFGWSVSISGSTIVVGAPLESSGVNGSAGRAYEFDAVTGDLVRTFSSPSPVTGVSINYYGVLNFGTSVSVVGSTVAIGDPEADGLDYAGPTRSGAVYEYNLATSSTTVLTSPRPAFDGMFGWSVQLGLGGVWLAVGAPNETSPTLANPGMAYLFNTRLGAAETSQFTSPNPVSNASSLAGNFGWAVAVNSNQVVVGAPYEGFNDSGNAYVFRSPAYTLSGGSSPSVGEGFGDSVATSGPYVVVGAPSWADNEGAAWVLDTQTSTEVQLQSPVPSSESEFGFTVGVSGNLVVVGGPAFSNTSYTGLGSAWVFNASTGADLGAITIPAGYLGNDLGFGTAVAISGTTVLVGAPLYDSDNGTVFVCGALTGTCVSTFEPTVSLGAEVGSSVAVNGSQAIVGAPYANSTTGAPVAGAGLAWILNLGVTITSTELNSPDPQGDGWFGSAVGIDQGSVIVGAPLESTEGIDYTGDAYVFNSTTGALAKTLVSPNPYEYGFFGGAVGIAGVTAVVGAPDESSSSAQQGNVFAGGNAYLYSLQSGIPTLAFPAPDASTYGALGASVAISDRTVVMGAPDESPVLGNSAGCAYIL